MKTFLSPQGHLSAPQSLLHSSPWTHPQAGSNAITWLLAPSLDPHPQIFTSGPHGPGRIRRADVEDEAPHPLTLQCPSESGWSLHPHPIHLGRRRWVIAKGHAQRHLRELRLGCGGLASCSSAAPRGNQTPAWERGADPKGITAWSQVQLNPAWPSQTQPRSAKVYTQEQEKIHAVAVSPRDVGIVCHRASL